MKEEPYWTHSSYSCAKWGQAVLWLILSYFCCCLPSSQGATAISKLLESIPTLGPSCFMQARLPMKVLPVGCVAAWGSIQSGEISDRSAALMVPRFYEPKLQSFRIKAFSSKIRSVTAITYFPVHVICSGPPPSCLVSRCDGGSNGDNSGILFSELPAQASSYSTGKPKFVVTVTLFLCDIHQVFV